MYHDLYTIERVVQQHRKEMLTKAEQAGLVRIAEEPRKVLGLRHRVPFVLNSLLAWRNRRVDELPDPSPFVSSQKLAVLQIRSKPASQKKALGTFI